MVAPGGGHIGGAPTGFPMNQGTTGQGQFSGGFPQQHQHQQQHIQAMQQQQQQQVSTCWYFSYVRRWREGGRERVCVHVCVCVCVREREREREGEREPAFSSCFPLTADGLHPGAAATSQRRTEEERSGDTKAKTDEH